VYRKIIAVTSVALYALLAFLAVIGTDFHDRSYPQAIGTQSRLIVDFSNADVPAAQALEVLQALDRDDDLGLYKLAPDLDARGSQVFVDLSGETGSRSVGWFGDHAAAQIVGVDRLVNSSADGTYLVTRTERLAEAVQTLSARGVGVQRVDAAPFDSLARLAQQAGFVAPVLAACALIAALTVLWLAVKARSRALRVLGGTAPWRIQTRDLGVLVATLVVSAVVVALVAAVAVGVVRGWAYAPLFLVILAGLEGVTVAVAVTVALVLSSASWPSVDSLARRVPAVKNLRWTARAVQLVTLVMLIAFTGPAWAAAADAQRTAQRLDAWNALSDQVMLSFGMPDEDLDTVAPQVGRVVASAEDDGQAALSYTITEQQWEGDFGEYSRIAFVNASWISLMTDALGAEAVTPVPIDSVRDTVVRELGPSIALWNDAGTDAAATVDRLRAFTPSGDRPFPVIEGGAAGRLDFASGALILEVPRISALFDDPNIVSVASTGNIVFSGADQTQSRLDDARLTAAGLADLGIDGTIRPLYVAEQGILEAQFAAYLSHVLAVSLIALAVAFLVSSAVTAMVFALMNARRDFPLRLTGAGWSRIVSSRTLVDVGAATALGIALVAVQPESTRVVTAVASVSAVVVLYATHLVATRAVFGRVATRKL